jgi:hypothetical protein
MTAYLRVSGLKLQNFSGIKELDIQIKPDAGTVLVNGAAGSGKSSIIDAIRWVLVGDHVGMDCIPFETMQGYTEWTEQSAEVTFIRSIGHGFEDETIVFTRSRKKGSATTILNIRQGENNITSPEEVRKVLNGITSTTLIGSNWEYNLHGKKEDRVWWVQGDELMKSTLERFATAEESNHFTKKIGIDHCIGRLDERLKELHNEKIKLGGFAKSDSDRLETLQNEASDLEEELKLAKSELTDAESDLEEFLALPENQGLDKGKTKVEITSNKLSIRRLERQITNCRIDRDNFKDYLYHTAIQMVQNEGYFGDNPPDGVAKQIRDAAVTLLNSPEKDSWPVETIDTLEDLKGRDGLSIRSLLRTHNLAKITEFQDSSSELVNALVARDEHSIESSEQLERLVDLKELESSKKKLLGKKKEEVEKNSLAQTKLLTKQKESADKVKIEELETITKNLKKIIVTSIEKTCEEHSQNRIERGNAVLESMGLHYQLRFSTEEETTAFGKRHFRNIDDGSAIGVGGRAGSLSSGQSAVCFAALLAAEFQSNKLTLPLFLDDTIDKADHEQITKVSEGLNKWANKEGCQIWICSNAVRKGIDDVNSKHCTSQIFALTSDSHGSGNQRIHHNRTQTDFEVVTHD